MAQIGPVTLTCIADNAVESIQSALAAIESSGTAPHGFDDLFAGLGSDLVANLREDAVDLLFAEPVLRTADGHWNALSSPASGTSNLWPQSPVTGMWPLIVVAMAGLSFRS